MRLEDYGCQRPGRVGKGEFRPKPLTEPYLKVSPHNGSCYTNLSLPAKHNPVASGKTGSGIEPLPVPTIDMPGLCLFGSVYTVFLPILQDVALKGEKPCSVQSFYSGHSTLPSP